MTEMASAGDTAMEMPLAKSREKILCKPGDEKENFRVTALYNLWLFPS